MKRFIVLFVFFELVLSIRAQYGPVGFVNCNDGINGITGGSAGQVVRVSNRQDIGSYAIGVHTQANVVSENNWFGQRVNHPFEQMYATSPDDLDNHLLATTGALTCNPGTLLYGQPYYWRVDVVTTDGQTVQGDVWTFSAPARAIQHRLLRREGRLGLDGTVG